jgi:hypothetical protein
MPASWKGLFDRVRPKKYGRKPPLILLNGLAEQSESWYRNARFGPGSSTSTPRT